MVELGLVLPEEDEDWSIHVVWVRRKGGDNLPWSHSPKWFTCVWSLTQCKDAADQTLGWLAARLSLHLQRFILVSRDNFVEEVMAILRLEGKEVDRVAREKLSLYLLLKRRELLHSSPKYNQRIEEFLLMLTNIDRLLQDCPSVTQYIEAAQQMIPVYAQTRGISLTLFDVADLALALAQEKKEWSRVLSENELFPPLEIDKLSDKELRRELRILWKGSLIDFANREEIDYSTLVNWLYNKVENCQVKEALSRWLKKRLGIN